MIQNDNKNFFNFRVLDKFKLAILITFLSGCSTYSNKWSCPDSNGLGCEMLRSIDKKIDSGEISEVYARKCKGKYCKEGAIEPSKEGLNAKKYLPKEVEEIVIEEEQFSDEEKL
jgi:hypothetical protein